MLCPLLESNPLAGGATNWQVNVEPNSLGHVRQVETSVAASPVTPGLLVANWMELNAPEICEDFRVTVGYGVSTDAGDSWTTGLFTSEDLGDDFDLASDPGTAAGGNGHLYMSFIGWTCATTIPRGVFLTRWNASSQSFENIKTLFR